MVVIVRSVIVGSSSVSSASVVGSAVILVVGIGVVLGFCATLACFSSFGVFCGFVHCLDDPIFAKGKCCNRF